MITLTGKEKLVAKYPVVRIDSGHVVSDVSNAIQTRNKYSDGSSRVYFWPAHNVKKDGMPSAVGNGTRIGVFREPRYTGMYATEEEKNQTRLVGGYGVTTPEREALATPIRIRISELQEELTKLGEQLKEVYLEKENSL